MTDNTNNETTEPDSITLNPSIRPILIWPDDRLKIKSKEVIEFNDQLVLLIADLITTMKANNGIGLAAPQIGEPYRVIAVQTFGLKDGSPLPNDLPLVLVNPEIIETDDTKMFELEEGCLSVPGYFKIRKRPSRVVVKYNTPEGNEQIRDFLGIYAFAIQHEIDHLEGKTFVDDLSKLKQLYVKKKIQKTLNSVE